MFKAFKATECNDEVFSGDQLCQHAGNNHFILTHVNDQQEYLTASFQ
jgi:hypothetical protein